MKKLFTITVSAVLLAIMLPFAIRSYNQFREEQRQQDSLDNAYKEALAHYIDKDFNDEGMPSCADPKSCVDFSAVIKSYIDGTVSLYPKDTTVAHTEKMIDETLYPSCPKDVPQDLYDLMIMQLEMDNFTSDCERYLRLEERIAEAKDKNGSSREGEQEQKRVLKRLLYETGKYSGAHIKDERIRAISVANIKDLSEKFFGIINDRLSEKQASDLMIKVQNRIDSCSEYRKIYVDTTWLDSYLPKFVSYCKSVEPRFQRLLFNKWSANTAMGTLCLIQREPYIDNQCAEAIYASKEDDYSIFGIKLMERIMDSGRYSQWLPLVWKHWRYLYEAEYCDLSKDGAIPNWFYNNRKLQVYSTILRYLKKHPDDIDARTAACFLLNDRNIRIYGPFKYGNQTITEDFLYLLSDDKDYEQ